ncbi:DegV family protein [Neobacillus niacini]|uniref:DegV family protein n=1 Tax=Neobacillus niacini TaxID=86668 RepID=UPI00204204E6|nr:DegV family protein [Neobacillus niacini]MCM3692723.1 DegV family protein [Neobacillus niacini]
MSKIKIVTDSTMDMTKEQADQLGVVVVPLSVTINGETYLDRVEIQPAEFMETMKGLKDLPKSSQPSAGTFLEVYDRLGEEGYEVISIHMTGKMSGTIRSAESAAQMTKTKVSVVDSEFISIALQFQVREAAEMAKQGKSVEEILNRLDTVRQNSKLYIMIDTLENMVKGGRIGKGKAFIGSLLNIKPIASLEGAEYNPVAKVRSHSQVVKWLTKQFVEDVKAKTVKRVGIVHADALELATKLKDSIIELTGYTDISVDQTGPTISTHTGPGTIAIMYYYE